MRNGTLETVDDRPAVRLERRLPHPVERVWRAVSEPSELAQWFVAPFDWTPATGETFTSMEQAGEVTEVDPPNVLAWTWPRQGIPASCGQMTLRHRSRDRSSVRSRTTTRS